jgi:hypothetical protein
VNVSQQLGAAIGIAVLVTVFNSAAGHAQLVPGDTTAATLYALRDVFYVTGVFALGALATIVFGVDRFARAEAPVEAATSGGDGDGDGFSVNPSALAAQDADGGRLTEAALSA